MGHPKAQVRYEGDAPLLSIGLAVYNGARHLREAIDSLLAQDVGSLELIISDNASTDATPEICAEYAARDARIRYVRNESNIGAAANFNRVFELSAGRYFMWGSDDDVWDPSFARRCIEVLASNPDAVLCSTGVSIIGDDGRPRLDVPYRNLDTVGMALHQRVSGLVEKGLWYDVYSVIRPEAMKATGLYRPVYGGDVLLLLELALLGEFAVIPDELFKYRLPTVPKTTRQHFEEITGREAAAKRHSRKPWTTLAFDCLAMLRCIGNERPEIVAGAENALIEALVSRKSTWGRSILGENGYSPRALRSTNRTRNLIGESIERVAESGDDRAIEHAETVWRVSKGMRIAVARRTILWVLRPFTDRQSALDAEQTTSIGMLADELKLLRTRVEALEQLQAPEKSGTQDDVASS